MSNMETKYEDGRCMQNLKKISKSLNKVSGQLDNILFDNKLPIQRTLFIKKSIYFTFFIEFIINMKFVRSNTIAR